MGTKCGELPAARGSAYGEVFTRRWVVDTILDLVGYTADANLAGLTIIEPAIGHGAFLLPIVDRLVSAATRLGIPFCELADSIRSFDLQPHLVEMCRNSVYDYLVTNGCEARIASTLIKNWIQHGDYLLDDIPTKADFIVGNPPYIRMDDLDPAALQKYRKKWMTMTGRCDIYVPFIERSLALLKPSGRLGYICADRWMHNSYGAKLREHITKSHSIDAIWRMHDVDAFERKVSAYPAIFIASSRPQGKTVVIETTETFGKLDAPAATAFTQGTEVAKKQGNWTGRRFNKWYSGSDFWPAGNTDAMDILTQLSLSHQLLDDGGFTRISIGVATGADDAYIVSPKTDVEQDRLLPIVMSQDIRTGKLTIPTKVMINPWSHSGDLVNLKEYPKMTRFLASHPAVSERFVARKNPTTWYRTIDRVYPGIAERPKLLLQDMKQSITPVLDPGGYYPHHNLYYIVSDVWDMEVLGGLLLSKIAEAFVSAYCVRMRGGTLRFQAQYLRKIRVPRPDEIDGEVAEALREAFRNGDREGATFAAARAYGIRAELFLGA